MDAIDRLFRWGADRDVKVNGIRTLAIPHQGFGMVATHPLEKGDVVMKIPVQAIRSLHSVPESLGSLLRKGMSIHGLLAAELALGPPDLEDWLALAPTSASFEESVPYFWHQELQNLLPTATHNLLQNQRTMIQRDWGLFNSHFPSVNEQKYLRAWFLIGTRAFYYETDDTLRYPWHDRLALVPVADMLNHAVEGCRVSFSSHGYTVSADRRYSVGDQICISYGGHSNDYLLAEYGFFMDDNPNDQVCLDHLILPKLSPRQSAELRLRYGAVGGLTLSSKSQPCEKTKIALQLLSCSEDKTSADLARHGADDASLLLKSTLTEFRDDIVRIQQEILFLSVGTPTQRQALSHRWKQVEKIVLGALGPASSACQANCRKEIYLT